MVPLKYKIPVLCILAFSVSSSVFFILNFLEPPNIIFLCSTIFQYYLILFEKTVCIHNCVIKIWVGWLCDWHKTLSLQLSWMKPILWHNVSNLCILIDYMIFIDNTTAIVEIDFIQLLTSMSFWNNFFVCGSWGGGISLRVSTPAHSLPEVHYYWSV